MDHPNPDITAPEGDAMGEPLEGAVRDRILRLHPQAGDGGISGTVLRKASGWDQAGTFAAEIMSRFRSPGEAPSTAMPLALPVMESRTPATGSAPVSGMPSPLSPVNRRPLPVVGSFPSGKLGPGRLVQRKVMSGADSTPSIQAAGTVSGKLSALETLVEGFHKKSVGSDNYESKADVTPQPLSPPTAAGIWAMTARLQGTLGARLVQRHSAFVGTSAEAEVGVGSPLSLPGMPMVGVERTPVAGDPKGIGRAVQRQASGGTESGKSMANKISTDPSAVGADPRVRPPFLKQQREGVSTSLKTDAVQLRPEPPATAQPPVKPTPPAGATLQRKGGTASLSDDIFSRLPNLSSGAAVPPLPLAASVVPTSGAAMESLSASSIPISSGGVSPAATASAVVLSPSPKGIPPVGGALGEGFLPVISRSPSVGGVVSRKAKESVPGPESAWGGLRSGASETAGAVFFPRTDPFPSSLPAVPVKAAGSAFSAPLPLIQSRGMAGSGAAESIQRKRSDSLPVAQRSEATGSSAAVTSSNGMSESAASFSPSASPETGESTVTPGATIDLERVADEVYRLIERRLIVEKESRGL